MVPRQIGKTSIQVSSRDYTLPPKSVWRLGWLALRADAAGALRAIWWLATRRRVRGRAALFRTASTHPRYYDWSARNFEAAAFRKSERPDDFPTPLFVIVCEVAELKNIGATLDSIAEHFQTVECFCVVDRKDGDSPHIDSCAPLISTNDLHERLCRTDSPVIFLRGGDVLSPLARPALHAAFGADAATSVYYWDDDLVLNGTMSDPWLKPQWNALQFLAQDYLSFSCALPASLVVSALSELGSDRLDVPAITAWSVLSGSAQAIVKINAVLVHRTAPRKKFASSGRQKVISKLAKSFRILPKPALPADRVLRPLPPTAPSLAIIIPTRDQLGLLRACVKGMMAAVYPGRKEIVIVDNGSSEPETMAFFEELEDVGVTILRDDSPFNYAALNNRAVATVDCDLLCFINNDVEPLDDRWLQIMAGFAIEKNVGAVGARLLYPDLTIQHAGVVIGMGGAAGHILRGTEGDPQLHHGLVAATRYSTAVTAACLLLDKRKFEEVGGFDEERLAVAFNDVDLCLKLHAAGYDNVYAADAVLIHHESKSRGLDLSIEKRRRFEGELTHLQDRWNTKTWSDPYYHPRYNRGDEALSIEP